MENICPVCNQQKKEIPAGVSKRTGKPYNAFSVCPNKCQQTNSGVQKEADQGKLIIEKLDQIIEYLKNLV